MTQDQTGTTAAQDDSNQRKNEIWKRSNASRPDADGFVSFGDVARMLLSNQCQYISRFVNTNFADDHNYPYMGDGLRITGSTNMYHSLRIHIDDVDEFVRRVRDFWNDRLKGVR